MQIGDDDIHTEPLQELNRLFRIGDGYWIVALLSEHKLYNSTSRVIMLSN